MTTKELREFRYKFECDINPEDYIGKDCYDDWGGASIWLVNIGVEYNAYADEGEDCSSIYPTYLNDGYIDIDTSEFVGYSIDFTDKCWKRKLEDAMCEALIELHNL